MAMNTTTTDKTREAFGNVADKAKDVASSFADKAKDAAGNFADMAKDAAGNLTDKAKDATTTVTHKAEDLAKNAGQYAKQAGQKADDATASFGHTIKSAADTVRAKGPHDGILGSATSATAGAMESTGRYLEQEKLSGMAHDMTELIRRNPIQALLIAGAIGFLVGRTLKS
jgi:ElaB/YqjD/DUF883 family membrane-anchored ribosome-binding protein